MQHRQLGFVTVHLPQGEAFRPDGVHNAQGIEEPASRFATLFFKLAGTAQMLHHGVRILGHTVMDDGIQQHYETPDCTPSVAFRTKKSQSTTDCFRNNSHADICSTDNTCSSPPNPRSSPWNAVWHRYIFRPKRRPMFNPCIIPLYRQHVVSPAYALVILPPNMLKRRYDGVIIKYGPRRSYRRCARAMLPRSPMTV
jgi:hypothetical protein